MHCVYGESKGNAKEKQQEGYICIAIQEEDFRIAKPTI